MLLFGIFVFTACVLILASIKMASLMIGNPVTIPHFGILSPTHAFLMYPSLLFQVAFWTNELGILTL